MFDERAALKIRLEQIKELEVMVLQGWQKERTEILDRIREMDETQSIKEEQIQILSRNIDSVPYLSTSEHEIHEDNEDKVELNDLMIEAIKILKSHTAAISGVELAKEIKNKTGKSVSNPTVFMNRLMKADFNIKKPYRGQYIYKN